MTTENQTQEMNKPVRPIDLPDKFWDEAEGVRLDALIKSYLALESRMSQKTLGDGQEDHENKMIFDDMNAIYKHLGRPDSPDAYCVTCDHGYFNIDQDLNKRLYDLGFTQEQAQAVYDLAAEKLVPMMLDLVAGVRAEAETEKLMAHFGGPAQWQRISRQLFNFGRKSLPKETFQAMSTSFDGVKALYELMTRHGENQMTFGSGTGGNDTGADGLYQLMRDPKYWRDHDPKIVAKVAEGFDRLYAQ